MQFTTDTCFWTHIYFLYQNISIDLRKPLNNYLWGITSVVQKELINYELSEFIDFRKVNLIPFTEIEYSRFISQYNYLKPFGEADISLLYTAKRDNNIIITDDGALYIEAFSMHIKVMYLPEWCLFLVQANFLSRNACYKIFRFWDETHTYSKHKINKWKNILAKL